MSINWEKEGYKIGDKVCLVAKAKHDNPTIHEVEVIYVGTKNLKVKKKLKIKAGYKDHEIEFTDRKLYSRTSWVCYEIYKNIEEYEHILTLERESDNLKIELKTK